jgi:hypothetical protein
LPEICSLTNVAPFSAFQVDNALPLISDGLMVSPREATARLVPRLVVDYPMAIAFAVDNRQGTIATHLPHQRVNGHLLPTTHNLHHLVQSGPAILPAPSQESQHQPCSLCHASMLLSSHARVCSGQSRRLPAQLPNRGRETPSSAPNAPTTHSTALVSSASQP